VLAALQGSTLVIILLRPTVHHDEGGWSTTVMGRTSVRLTMWRPFIASYVRFLYVVALQGGMDLNARGLDP
jgi:hypothetical protein